MVLEGCEADLDEKEAKRLEGEFVERVRLGLRGRMFFRTGDGFFGVCPESTDYGDIIVVVLGVPSPLVVRPIQHSRRCCYRVVGPCYMPGAMREECLRGQFPAGWIVTYWEIEGRDFLIFIQADAITQKDPRAPLPHPWRYRYRSFEEPHETEPAAVKDFLPQFFENVETKEKTMFDPKTST
jgi:hypothetical protein